MKGIIIYENDLGVINAAKLKHASFCCEFTADDIMDTLKGTPVICKSANCDKDDTYDFETGALIALMKMCGVEKVTKACDELYRDDNYKNTLQEMTENNEKLMEENNHLKYIKSCNESTIKSLEDTNETLKKEKEQIIVAKNVLYNRLEKENEKLQHDYDLCKNSENALKCSVDYLNKTIAKLNTAIYGYKQDLYKVTKRCEELEIKESTINKQQEQLDKREEKMSVYFGGRGNGKQYKALVTLFKKLDQKKVDEAYKEAYNTALPLWQKEALKQMFDIHKETKEWLYRIPTKREEMWDKIFALRKEKHPIIVVKKEDVNTFLHEIENKIPEITWASGVKIFVEKGIIKDIYNELKHCDTIYFRISKENKLSYSINPYIYPYYEFEHIAYLPPMRWDLFKKGRRIIRVTPDKLDEFMRKFIIKFDGIMMPNLISYKEFTHVFVMISDYHYDNKPTVHIMSPYDLVSNQFENSKKYSDKKIVDWEDVR